MQYRVKLYNRDNEMISNDVWYGYSIDNVKFWVDLLMQSMMNSGNYRGLKYEIESI